MQVFNLQEYTPEFTKDPVYNEAVGRPISSGVVFYKTETGRDFYQVRNAWKDKSLWKVAYDQTGRVFSVSKDIMQVVVHAGTSIVEVMHLPQNFDAHMFWYFRDGLIVEDLEMVQTTHRNKLLSNLDASITILQNRVDDEDATEQHIADLKRQREVRVALRKLDMKVKIDEWPSV